MRLVMAKDVLFEIIEECGVISEKSKGWQTELNIVKWGDNEPKFDIRSWSPDHTKMGKGISLTADEISTLRELLDAIED